MIEIKNLAGDVLHVDRKMDTFRRALSDWIESLPVAQARWNGNPPAPYPMRWIDFRGQLLSHVDFTCLDLTGSDFTGATIEGCLFSQCILTDCIGLPEAPRVENLDSQILKKISNGKPRLGEECNWGSKGFLEMRSYHICGTGHCRAGWAIHLAGKPGYALQDRVGPNAAGALIYNASYPGRSIPWFYASNEKALESIQASAALETEVLK